MRTQATQPNELHTNHISDRHRHDSVVRYKDGEAQPEHNGVRTSPIEVAPKRIISATTYNGQFPGRLLRFKEGRQVKVDLRRTLRLGIFRR